MNKLTEKKTKERAELVARERELSKIKISKEDVDLMVRIVHVHFINLTFCLKNKTLNALRQFIYLSVYIFNWHMTLLYI